MKSLIIIILIAALVAVSGQQGCERKESWRECYTDSDCFKVQITCCPCAMGGTELCVPETLAPLYQENLKKCPPENERICIAINNCKIRSCSCVKGICQEK